MNPTIYSTNEFESKYTYSGNDLGACWTKEKTTFRVWAPTATSVKINLYTSGTVDADDMIHQLEMTADVNGTWVVEKNGDLNGVYYTYLVCVDGITREACDPYARTTGANGRRAMVIDLKSTDPEGWDTDCDPNAKLSFTDSVIYELHVRDLSIDPSSGIKNAGKFLGVIEPGTKTHNGTPTGLDHMKSLGITHLHLLPVYDYGSVDEAHLDKAQFNWGYDPVNFNTPEGSYATDPFNGAVRVAEMKKMVKGLHDNGISVIMDVVYNHVFDAGSFCFNRIVPQYFSRTDGQCHYSNGSGCGNDTASERSMVRKYIVDSVKYWADEYHIDGFRFDLVGLIDTVTINELMHEVHKTHPNVIFYGEGWDMDTMVTKPNICMTIQRNSEMVPGFAFFSDTIRDCLKGSVFYDNTPGFVAGATALESIVCKCFKGMPDWCPSPSQTINYVSCHDNMSLHDRIWSTLPNAPETDLIRMNKLAASIYLLSEGIPFFQAGEEFLRTKRDENGKIVENSYNAPDSVNSIKWVNLEKYADVVSYYRGLIAFRKAHPALRIQTAADVNRYVFELNGLQPGVVAFHIENGVPGEPAKEMFLAFNSNTQPVKLSLPQGKWQVHINDTQAGNAAIETVEETVLVPAISPMVLVLES